MPFDQGLTYFSILYLLIKFSPEDIKPDPPDSPAKGPFMKPSEENNMRLLGPNDNKG